MLRARAVMAAHRRNLGLVRGDPTLLAQAILVPVVVLVLCAVIFGGGGDDWPVAVTDRAATTHSRHLVTTIEQTGSQISPYFDIVPSRPAQAAELLERGRLQLHLEIPPDFDDRRTVLASTYNINSDAMKNVRLRLIKALNAQDAHRGELPVTVGLDTVADEDVPRTAFIAGSSTLLALFFGAALIAANLFALEREARTSKEMALTPLGPACAGLGAVLSSTSLAFLTALPTALIGWLAFDLAPAGTDVVRVAAFLLPVVISAAGVGVVLAHLLRRHRAVQPVIILGGVISFFATGGLVGVADLPPRARMLADAWPVSRIFEWANPVLHGFVDTVSLGQWAAVASAAMVGLVSAAVTAQRERTLVARGR